MESTAPAAISGYFVSFSCAYLAIATGTVAVWRAVRLSATTKSFQLWMNTRIAVAAIPGITTGTITRLSICSVPQPSMRAASSSSRGTSRMNDAISQIPSGRLRVACARITAGYVL